MIRHVRLCYVEIMRTRPNLSLMSLVVDNKVINAQPTLSGTYTCLMFNKNSLSLFPIKKALVMEAGSAMLADVRPSLLLKFADLRECKNSKDTTSIVTSYSRNDRTTLIEF